MLDKKKPHAFLPPIAFAIVMSTGTLACATLTQSEALPLLKYPAAVLCWLNFAIFICLAPYAIASWLSHREKLHDVCQQPASISLFSTSGIALLVMAHQCLLFGLGYLAALIFWLAGAIVTFSLNLIILARVFTGQHCQEEITPVFFIPVVGLLVLPAGGAALSLEMPQFLAQIVSLISLLGLGGGLLLYGGLFAALLQRHLLLAPIPDHLAPTYWIHLAPLGWGSISVIATSQILAPQNVQETMRFLGMLAWGASAWWVIMAAILTIRAMIRHGMGFSLAWWSFIFPLGSFTLLTRMLAISYAGTISFAVWLLMAFIWTLDAIKTLRLLFADADFRGAK